MIDRNLLLHVRDQETLCALLKIDERDGGLGWPIADEDPFQLEPEIAGGMKAGVSVSRLIPASADEKRLVLLVEFDEPYARRDLRALLASLRREIRARGRFPNNTGIGDTIFIVSAPDTEGSYGDVRFVLFEERDGGQPRIRSFGWRRGDPGRTVLERNLAGLVWTKRDQWESAWDVEGLTTEFFREYRRVFEQVETLVTGVQGDKRLFVQRLFNRLLFIQFLSRKRWLRFKGSNDYLQALWDNRDQRAGMYTGNLLPLFFAGLNNEQGRNLNRNNGPLQAIIGEVPFLNGGLFEKAPDEVQGETVPDEALSLIIKDLFSRWNFTITESTPLDIDVAVDPEMLGKVFEELVTGRHETGSYYTPRPVVAFMCREALKGYLGGYENLVDDHDATEISVDEARGLIQKLEAIKVCDPACGSGAYLLGMLQEIHALQRLLDTTAHRRNARDDYERKLTIIENCLYGVDIDRFAVNIAWLRLWLALVIDDSRNPLEQPETDVSLPNLDVKIGVGDSLLAADPHTLLAKGQLGLAKPLIEQYREEKSRYMRAHNMEEKKQLRDEMDATCIEIRGFLRSAAPKGSFEWAVGFVEAFVNGYDEPAGFDVVLANPPYVRADAQFKHVLPDKAAQQAAIAQWKATRQKLGKSGIYKTLHEKWDLYIPFLERAHQLLRDGGQMVFIIPDAYNGNKYALKSHSFFLANSVVERIDFCSDIPLFKAGVFNTILRFAKSTPPTVHAPVRARRWGSNPNDFEPNCEILSPLRQVDAKNRIFRLVAESNAEVRGDSMPLANICYISKGAVLHANEKLAHAAFKLADLVSETRDTHHPKRLFMGKNMGSWVITGNSWLEYGTGRAPSLFSRPTFPELYEVPAKLVSMRITAGAPRVVFDDQQCWHNHTAFSFVPWHYLAGICNNSIGKVARYRSEPIGKPAISVERGELETISQRFDIHYLHGILNSEFARLWMERNRRSKLDVYSEDWKQFPVKDVAPMVQKPIADIVGRILAIKKVDATADVTELEAELNRQVDFLYLHRVGDETYDEWLAKTEAERGTAVEEIRNIISAGESTLVEFKQSLEYVDPAEVASVPEQQRSQKLAEKRKAVVHSALKTLCAFLNTKGGTLLIGIHDSGEIIGIEPDYTLCGNKKDRDGFENKLTDFLKSRINPIPTALDIRFVVVDGKTVCRIDAPADPRPHYLDNRLYVRLGNSTEELTGRHLEDWIEGRRQFIST